MLTIHTNNEEHKRILRMYQSFFNRVPDVGGANYWIQRYEDGLSYEEIVRHFEYSIEFDALYSPLDDPAFIRAVYRNVLGRKPDAGGYQYWLSRLVSGELSRSRLIDYFSDSEEFRSRVPYGPSAFDNYVERIAAGSIITQLAPGVQQFSNGYMHTIVINPSVEGNFNVSPGQKAVTVGSYGGVAAINGNWFGSYLPNWFAGYSVSDGVALGSVDGDLRRAWFGETGDGNWAYDLYHGENIPPVAEEAVSGLMLINDGKINPYTTTETNDPTLVYRNPRSAICVNNTDGAVILFVADGRARNRPGMTGLELATKMQAYGCEFAMMLDGGGSSTLYADKLGIINSPSDGSARPVSNQMMYETEGQWVE